MQYVYDSTIRYITPRKIKVYNGVALNVGRLFDTNVIVPEYKQGTIEPLRILTKEEDDVTVIGGGFGVSAVVAAHQASSVTVFEGSRKQANIVRETAKLNRVAKDVTVIEAIVGRAIDVYGESHADTVMQPSELDRCDVLEMDCEGAEEFILKELDITPRVIIVESHPQFGVTPESIRQHLMDNGYDIEGAFELQSGNLTFAAVRNG
jgi:hypothetical protein